MHITKNYLADQGAISKTTKVPLILGIWGPKGCGKTFQVSCCWGLLSRAPPQACPL
jgi:pantothenate kinase-related protein Tda10